MTRSKALITSAIVAAALLSAYGIGYLALRIGGVIVRWDTPVSGNPNFIWISYNGDTSPSHVRWMNRLFAFYKPMVGAEQIVRNEVQRLHRS